MKLGVNIDHVATLRQARREFDPDPLLAAKIALKNGADSIVAHLREDRRHIQDKDVFALRTFVRNFNLEMSIAKDVVAIALKVKPDVATLVPERREEITTEGGLDVIRHFSKIKDVVNRLQDRRIRVSLFIAAKKDQIDASLKTGAQVIEIHTGTYAHAKSASAHKKELSQISSMAKYGTSIGLRVSAGHGLNYENTKAILKIKEIEELNIGHSIISRAVFVGLDQAIKEMVELIK